MAWFALALLVVGSVVLVLGPRLVTPRFSGRRFAPCPRSPNCVSSDAADPARRVEPLRLLGPAQAALAALEAAVVALPRTRVVERDGAYLRAESRSLVCGFVDDLELEVTGDAVRVRSASRLGWSDFAVNRARVERLRQALARRLARAPDRPPPSPPGSLAP